MICEVAFGMPALPTLTMEQVVLDRKVMTLVSYVTRIQAHLANKAAGASADMPAGTLGAGHTAADSMPAMD